MTCLRRTARGGLMVGCLAGLWLGLADFGASWLWLPVPRDRAWLLVRLLATFMPVGAVLGLLAALSGAVVARLTARLSPRRAALAWPLPFALASILPLGAIAALLCKGGSMARIAARVPIELGLRVALPLLLYAVLLAGLLAQRRLRAAPTRALPAGAALLAVAFALGKLNQHFLPNLYDYLHGLLALVVWASAALGLALFGFLAPRFRAHGSALAQPRTAWLCAVLLTAIAVLNARTLDDNLNVRVALFDARAASSRALMLTADPLLRRLEPPARPPSIATSTARDTHRVSAPALAPGAHVLLVTIDALRADHLGTYGYGRPVSPQLDVLAARSLTFERAYAQAPHSSYSLSSLHTSTYVHELVELNRPLPEATLASAFRDHGYHTAAFFTDGVFHTEGEKLRALRDTAFRFALFDHTNREAEQQTDRVLAEADRIMQQGEPPSFLWVHYFDVHEPYQETTFGSGEMDRYDSEILHVDRELERLVRELEARFSREVVIALTADHGEEFRDHGGVYHGSTLYDEQVRVPLFLRAPGLDAARVKSPVEVIDLAPTLLSVVGAPIPASMRGRDLRTITTSGGAAPAVFSAVLTKRMSLRWPYKLIADLRFDLFELYDLERDPEERHNLAGERPTVLGELRGLVYGWLDEIERGTGDPTSDEGAVARVEAGFQRALHLGRLGDRRAVAPTAALLLDRSAPTALRVEAGQNLAKLADKSALDALLRGLKTTPPEVAREAAIALGRMYDERARPALRRLMHTEDPYVRARAAVSLGRLRDKAAVPALIDALWVAPTQYEREEAVRWLGRLQHPAAVEPLLSLLPEFGLRYLLAVALGQIGDRRAYPALSGMLEWESRTNIRDEVVRGLGLLGDPRAIPGLVEVLDREPALKHTAESLIRLGALDPRSRSGLGGRDLAPDSKDLSGFADCVAGPLQHDWDYLARTHCTSTTARVMLALPLPREHADLPSGATLVLRGRRADGPVPIACTLSLSGWPFGDLTMDADYREHRTEVPAELLRKNQLALALSCPDEAARIALDHALVVPHTGASAARDSARAKPARHAQAIR